MIVRIDENTKLENPRSYPVGAVQELRNLLKAGAVARPDLRRVNFFEIDSDQEIYFIHISPVTGNVMLVAKWLRAPGEETNLSLPQVQDCPDFSECC